ncbi:MAG: hypothetical protein ABI563_01245 [Specibacter sp.]
MIGMLAGEEVVVAHRINEFFVAASLVERGLRVLDAALHGEPEYFSPARLAAAAGTAAGPVV